MEIFTDFTAYFVLTCYILTGHFSILSLSLDNIFHRKKAGNRSAKCKPILHFCFLLIRQKLPGVIE